MRRVSARGAEEVGWCRLARTLRSSQSDADRDGRAVADFRFDSNERGRGWGGCPVSVPAPRACVCGAPSPRKCGAAFDCRMAVVYCWMGGALSMTSNEECVQGEAGDGLGVLDDLDALLEEFKRARPKGGDDLLSFADRAAEWSLLKMGLMAKRALSEGDDAFALKVLEKLVGCWEKVRKQWGEGGGAVSATTGGGAMNEGERGSLDRALQQAAAKIVEGYGG